jgi:hypothetical protein
MTRQIKESDWKLFRRLHPVALERFCRSVIEELNQLSANCTGDYHKRYLELYELIREREKEIAVSFNDLRRSTAIIMIATIKGRQLLTDEEFMQFSPETREAVEVILGIRRW